MTKRKRRATKIILLRHAEKPEKDFAPFGVSRKGQRDKESLQVRGWQRAGALIALLCPPNETFSPSLAKPDFLYASKPLRRRGSRRPMQTLVPVAERLGLKINCEFPRFDFDQMLDEVFTCNGVVTICWQREYLPNIAQIIVGGAQITPSIWPEDRYDLLWVFDLNRSSGRYRFKQVPQRLLIGDSSAPIK